MKIFLTLVAVFILADILIVVYVVYRRYKKRMTPGKIEEIRKVWKTIIRQKDMPRAIIEADKLLDHTLSLMGFRGNLGAKLKKAGHLFKNVNAVWAAHKVRNNIAHQIHYEVSEGEYRKTMLQFRQAFIDLKIF